MILGLANSWNPFLFFSQNRKNVSLSTYFPKGTQYFYGYPAGEDSGFLNQVPPAMEELVAERAFGCAGEHVSVVGFAATAPPTIDHTLFAKFGMPQPDTDQVIILPEKINTSVRGNRRNQLLKTLC